MRKLILHSDQVIPDSLAMDRTIFEFVKERPVRIAYIGSNTDRVRKHFKQKQAYYAQLGITDMKYFDFDLEFTKAQYEELTDYHVFHLSGGNTNYFLTSLQRTNGLNFLRESALAGKVLVGVSAGAIITGADIKISALLGESVVQDATALSLVDFEFFPHYRDCDEDNSKLIQYSKNTNKKIYACADGNGIVVDGDNVRIFGEVLCFENGIMNSVCER